MRIREATVRDKQEIIKLFETARSFMIKSGNSEQWSNNYPPLHIIEEDIERQQSYLCIKNNKTEAVFTLLSSPDPTYINIEGRGWLNNDPYLTIHRIASYGRSKGVVQAIVDWAYKQKENIRIDTHEQNGPMRHLLNKLGFIYCGTIRVEDGSERLAFQKSKG